MFWAVLFITVGLLGLLQNLSFMAWSLGGLWKLWPLVLILIGVSVIFRDKQFRWIFSGSAGLLVGLIGFSMFQRGCDEIDTKWDSEGKLVKQTLSEGIDTSIARASFSFEGGAGSFIISDTTSSLISAETESTLGSYELTREDSVGMSYLTLAMNGGNVHWHGNGKNTVHIRLNPNPEWEMQFDVGAAKANFDLSPFKVRKVEFNGGASAVEIKLGDRSDLTDVDIETGVSSIKVLVPSTVDCEVRTDASLSSKEFDGLSKIGPGVWRSQEYGSKTGKVTINVDAGVSSIHIARY
jgi:hypothetical protein